MNRQIDYRRTKFLESLDDSRLKYKEIIERKFSLKYREGRLLNFINKNIVNYNTMGFKLNVSCEMKLKGKSLSLQSFDFYAKKISITFNPNGAEKCSEVIFEPKMSEGGYLYYSIFFQVDKKDILFGGYSLNWYKNRDEPDFWFLETNSHHPRPSTLDKKTFEDILEITRHNILNH
ncbi:hypothetical protein [Pantoea ananatis]|uniref:hypothetical protein n=1 Tax=Pantoea ananas TaxID=553 RepID=UPI0021E8D21B|nr:hypothetical protein [Pantoea ananatis]MCW0308087.1 hypothetical protein [Pantoea ananatis]MCW0340088.1 hypothetical protein [Pantoea ananatis]MCW0358061.1 hypothetical protein [Pantoea ananatis]MCW0362905.1 hypothetical protein [Pantoea ananatis]MCW1774139.1 hypothetical protein [Pantoea ananatis]